MVTAARACCTNTVFDKFVTGRYTSTASDKQLYQIVILALTSIKVQTGRYPSIQLD